MAAIWVKLTAPLGLLEKIRRVPIAKHRIEVIPSLPRVRRLAIGHFGDWRPRGGRHQTRLRGVGSEFDALEAYVPGMDPRHFDWNASARHQALLVRRYRAEQNQRIIFCMDTGRLMGDPIDGLERLDHAITAALLLSFFALRGGDQVGLFAYAARPELRLAPVAGIRRMQTLIKGCAGLAVRDEETNHALGLRNLLTGLHRRTLVVVFTEFTDTTSAELMVDYLGQVARQHLVIFCSLEDPLLARSFAEPPNTVRAIAESVAAESLQADRAAVLFKLRRKGIHLVSGSPGDAAASLVSRYTEIKRRELIG